MRKADDHETIRLEDFFRETRPIAARGDSLCEVANCTHIAFVSLRVSGRRRQLCLSHYEVLSFAFGKSRQERTA
jgi:hypothetical protein